MSAPEPTTSGFPWSAEMPSWLVWTASDGYDWQVTLGDHDDHHFIPGQSDDDRQAITVSAGPHAGARWFIVDDPRGLAAALIAAADATEECWRCVRERAVSLEEGALCGRHAQRAAATS